MGQFLQFVGGATLLFLAIIAIGSAVEAVVNTVKRIGAAEKRLNEHNEWLREVNRFRNDAACRLHKLEGAIGPSEPIQ